MNYLTLQQLQKNTPVFSLASIRLQEPAFRVDQLMRWQKKGYIRSIIRGWYMFSDVPITEALLMFIANKLISPSYISVESAFSLYNLIPEGVFQIISITSKKTQQLNAEFATFNYRHLKPSLLFGYHLSDTPFGKINIADLEKAVLDFLYLTPSANSSYYFHEMRLNHEVLKKLDLKKLNTYLKIFNHLALSERAKRFLQYVTHR
ncbi:MAG: hypothetical protein A3E54_06130 [Gammaproteobacteria bacterium RIFCSPHIGHO2_12_FULL_41_25]|nr:MAG: hypothetical protein A3E54_06130 [Gammaproteobacteria bacterium RIFCSPHIGHO2_12_FULL_41_25]OGT86635.1 MAG: hypothetical protein A3G86_04755 [Gammaproteobacteria bacterium RIFCSPLOWO2_12_FULL_42_18]